MMNELLPGARHSSHPCGSSGAGICQSAEFNVFSDVLQIYTKSSEYNVSQGKMKVGPLFPPPVICGIIPTVASPGLPVI